MRKYGLLHAAGILMLIVLFPVRSQQPAKPKPPPGLLSPAADGNCALPASPTDAREEPLAKLEELKKRLPGIIATWLKNRIAFAENYTPNIRVIRRIAPDKAKITFVMEYGQAKSETLDRDGIMTIYLTYCDGIWTTTGFDADWEEQNAERLKGHALWLMHAIDESGNK